jgi:phosphoribosylglycinamide formyltransferase-1
VPAGTPNETAVRRVGVLASGRGSNLQALIGAQAQGDLGAARLTVVVSNVESAPALERARRAGIAAVFKDTRGRTREAYDAELLAELKERGVDLLCLAGYLRLLTPAFVEAFPGPILNVHPSLLPAFPGLEAQRQAWEHGVKVSGATVHSGPILLQEAVAVRDDDTPESLGALILEVEHRLYPRALRTVVDGGYRVEGRRVLPKG